MAQPAPTNNLRRSTTASVIGATASSSAEKTTTTKFAATLGHTLPSNDVHASELHDEVEYDARSTLVDSDPTISDDDELNSEYI